MICIQYYQIIACCSVWIVGFGIVFLQIKEVIKEHEEYYDERQSDD